MFVFQKVYVLVRERVNVCVGKCMGKSEMERESACVGMPVKERDRESVRVL